LLGTASVLVANLRSWPALASQGKSPGKNAGAPLADLTRSPVYDGSTNLSLTYQPGSSVKLEQIIGDVDYAALARGSTVPTTSQTVRQCNVAGCDLGCSFEHQGKLLFLFGDTISNDPSMPWSTSAAPFVDYHAHDVFGWSTSTDPEAGLLINLYTKASGVPLFVEPPGVPMGGDDTPNAGISLDGKIYIVCNSGSDFSLSDPRVQEYSVLAKFDESTQAFTTGRTISRLPAGHFIIVSLHELPSGPLAPLPQVLMFGLGDQQATDAYLAIGPADGFENGAGTMYFTGLNQGQATWSDKETDAVPVVRDVVSPPTMGNLSVSYADDLSLWLMTFDGGRGSDDTLGVYFTYSPAPWGPWSAPQLIFNAARDNALGDFISNYDPHHPNVAGSPAGPAPGTHDIYRTRGADYAPRMVDRFTNVSGTTLTIYYTMSTWNPYTVVKMRSQFTIAPAAGSAA